MIEIIKNPSEEEWLANRKHNLNSTETAALYGHGYMTEFELFHIKSGNIEDTFIENERTVIGQHVESGIADAFAKMNNCMVKPFKDYYFDPTLDIGSSFDYQILKGFIDGVDLTDWALEVKNVDFLVYRDQWTDVEAPPHIEIQVQHQMMLNERPGTVICACVGGNQLKVILRRRNDRMINAIKKRIAEFWEDVRLGNAPDIKSYKDNANAIQQLYSQCEDGKVIEADEHIDFIAARYRDNRSTLKIIEEEREELKARLYELAGDASKIIGNGYSVDLGITKPNEGRKITDDMVGNVIGQRNGFRRCTVRSIKAKK